MVLERKTLKKKHIFSQRLVPVKSHWESVRALSATLHKQNLKKSNDMDGSNQMFSFIKYLWAIQQKNRS